MKSLCSYCEYRLKCSDASKLNCELTEDCDDFERRVTREKTKKNCQKKK